MGEVITLVIAALQSVLLKSVTAAVTTSVALSRTGAIAEL